MLQWIERGEGSGLKVTASARAFGETARRGRLFVTAAEASRADEDGFGRDLELKERDFLGRRRSLEGGGGVRSGEEGGSSRPMLVSHVAFTRRSEHEGRECAY
jgi:hypothetical protein